MLREFREVLQSIPDKEVDEFYTYLWGEHNKCEECGVCHNKCERTHILNYLRQYIKARRMCLNVGNEELSKSCMIKSRIILGWIEKFKKGE